MRTCGFVGWVELVELLDDAGGGAGGDEAAGAVEEVFLVGPDGAGAEARDFHLAQGLGVQVAKGEVALKGSGAPTRSRDSYKKGFR
jgi:ABC-type cobalamin transport system ATPase subunit